MHIKATKLIISRPCVLAWKFTLVGLAVTLLTTGAMAGNLDGVHFVDDLEQSLRGPAGKVGPARSDRSTSPRYRPAARTAPRYLPESYPQQSSSPKLSSTKRVTKPTSWYSNLSFKNPLDKLWGGSPNGPTTDRSAGNQRQPVRSAGSSVLGSPAPVFQASAVSPVQPTSKSRAATRRGGIAMRPPSRGNPPQGLLSFGQKKPAKPAKATPTNRTANRSPVRVAQHQAKLSVPAKGNAPSWSDRLPFPLAINQPKMPRFKSEPGIAMISDREEPPKPQPRAASNFAVSQQKLPEVVGPPRTLFHRGERDTRAVVLPPIVAKTPPSPSRSRANQGPKEVVNRHVASIPSALMPNVPMPNIHAERFVARPVKRLINPVVPMPVAPVPPTAADQKPPKKPSKKAVELLAHANRLSQVAGNENEYTTILQTCRQVLAIDSSPTAVKYGKQLASWAINRRGELKAEEGRTTEALLDYEGALRFDPTRWRAVHNRGVMAAQAGRYTDALNDFNRTLELNPKFAKAYSNRATLYVQAGKLQQAQNDYRQAIANDPDLAVAHKGCGRVFHILGQLESALQHLDAAALLAPNDARIVNNRGDLLSDMGRYRSAAANYQKAIELDSSLAIAYRNLAWLQATCPDKECRDHRLALANADRAIALLEEPGDLEFDTLSVAQAAGGDFDAAKASIDRALELASESEKANYQWRRSLYERGQPYVAEPASNIQQASYAH